MLVCILAKTMPIINAKVRSIVALLMNRHQSTPRIHVAIPDQSRSELSACDQFDHDSTMSAVERFRRKRFVL